MYEPDAGIAISFGVAALGTKTDIGEAVLDEIYDAHAGALYRYALSILGSREDAEDAVQDVFARIAREVSRLKRVRSLKAYLFTAARNSAYSRLRERQRRERDFDAVCIEIGSADRGEQAESEALMSAFAELPVDQREVLTLKVFEQMSLREIARMTSASVNTVASRYRYGIARLRKALEADENG